MPATEPEVTHVAFADESHWNKGRYRSLGMVTLRIEDIQRVENELRAIFEECGVSELKWARLRQARDRFAACELCKYAINAANTGLLRVDVLEWDTEDSRHNILKRDDIANLQRMYYHLFRNVLRTRWPDGSVWELCPDEHTAMDWANVQSYLDLAGTGVQIHRDLFTGDTFELQLREYFAIVQIQEVSSADNALIQLADLFAGMCVFSREGYEKYEGWLAFQTPTFFEPERRVPLGALDRERCTVLQAFDDSCKAHKLGVSLKSHRGLRTLDPSYPLNFWWYTPQSPMDKAPTKIRR